MYLCEKNDMFPCTECGCCCRRVGKAVKGGLIFPYKVKEDGSCEMLMSNNKCKVYDSRPIFCNISGLAGILGRDLDEFYKENIEICNRYMEEDGIPIRFRINNK